jgi:hypothetical protein
MMRRTMLSLTPGALLFSVSGSMVPGLKSQGSRL